jgi:hypothetical protein
VIPSISDFKNLPLQDEGIAPAGNAFAVWRQRSECASSCGTVDEQRSWDVWAARFE